MKKTLLVTSLICSGLALGSLSENAKADDSQPANTSSSQDQTQVNNGSTLANKQSVTLQQPSESDTNTVLSNFTKDSGISTTQDGVNYTVTQQGNDYQIELSQNMGQYNHLLAIYNYSPATHTFKQTGGDFQADTPMGQGAKQEAEKEANQQLGLNQVATWKDQYGIVHHVNSDGMDRQTIPGSTEVHYQDWTGDLPDNAVIKDSDNVQHMTRQEYKQCLQSQPQQQSQPQSQLQPQSQSQSQQSNQQYGNGLFIKDNQPQPASNQPNQSNSVDQNGNQSSQSKELPQTGNTNSKAGLGGLALASLTAMFALGKRKEEY